MQEVQDGRHEGAGTAASGEAEGVQQGARILIDSARGLLSAGSVVESLVDVQGHDVRVIRAEDVRVPDACALLLMQGMSAISALGPILHNGQHYLPIIADGFCPYEVPVRFARVVAGIPSEEPIPLEVLVAALTRT